MRRQTLEAKATLGPPRARTVEKLEAGDKTLSVASAPAGTGAADGVSSGWNFQGRRTAASQGFEENGGSCMPIVFLYAVPGSSWSLIINAKKSVAQS